MEPESFKSFQISWRRDWSALEFYCNNHIECVVNKVSRKLGVLRRLKISISKAVAERHKTIILLIFDYCDVAWHGCGKVNSDASLESLQHRAAKLIFPNSGLDTKELYANLGLVPLIYMRKTSHRPV